MSDKKWNRKAINDLQNELKQIKKELDNKRDIKKDLSTQLSRIKGIINSDNNEKNIKDFYGLQNNENTNIIKKENKQEQEQDVSLGIDRVLGLYKISNSRRWYDKVSILSYAMKTMSTLPREDFYTVMESITATANI